MWISPSEDILDLTQYIYESIVLSLPYRRVHEEGGCNPEMLAAFTEISEEEFDEMEAEVEESDVVGLDDRNKESLKALKRQMTDKEQLDTIEVCARRSIRQAFERRQKET